MRIQLTAVMAGPTGSYQAGEIADVDAAEAQALIEGGYAVAVEAPAPVVAEPATDTPVQP
jgi:hypothetical protein